MSMIHSPHWDENLGICTKHHISQVPCPQCLRENDPDIEVGSNETKHVSLGLDPNLAIRDLASDDRLFNHVT